MPTTESNVRCNFFENASRNLQTNFTNNFSLFQKECKTIESELIKYPLLACNSIDFDPNKHKCSSTTIKEYFELLPNVDCNVDLKSMNLVPVDLVDDSNALFRCILSLIDCSRQQDLIELKVRCLVDAVRHHREYINDCEHFEDASNDPDQTCTKNWSPFIHDKAHIDYPNIITVYILFSLAKIINIPIRSIYPTPSSKDLDENPCHPFKLINRTFYPPTDLHNQPQQNPIFIIWWPIQINQMTYFNSVPLFTTNQKIENLLLTQSNRSILANEIVKSSVIRRTGIYILIGTAIDDKKSRETFQRIKLMKTSIIELVEMIVADCQPNDIIEINICNHQLTQPPLIPFCLAKHVLTEENRKLIHNIEFSENKDFEPSIGISTAIDQLTRQATYYDRFYFFVDSLFHNTKKQNTANAILNRCISYRTIHPHIIQFSNQNHFQSIGTLQIHSFNHQQNKDRWKKTIFYGDQQQQSSSSSSSFEISPISDIEPIPPTIHTSIQYIHVPPSASQPIPINQPKKTHRDIDVNTTIHSTSSTNSYRVPTPNPMNDFVFNARFK